MRVRLVGPLVLGFAAIVLFSSIGVAQATRTWVSGVGDDANPCSRTAPCKTFAGAISKTAPGGEIDALDSGGFGALTITKSIIIDGGDVLAGVLVSGTNGFVVSAQTTDTVILRHLRFDGIGGSGLAGILFHSAASLTVEDCVIEGFGSWGIDFEPNAGTSTNLQVSNTSIRHSGGGIIVGNSATITTAMITGSWITGNQRAAVRADGNATVTVRKTVASDGLNGFTACTTVNSGLPTLILEDSSATNHVGFGVAGGPTSCVAGKVVMSNTVSMNNGSGLLFGPSGSVLSYGNNKVCCNAAANGPPSGTLTPQ
jgi:hypothetical protein